MTVQVLINSVDYTARLLKEGGPIVHKNDVDTFGSANANDAAFDLDNSDDNWTINNIDALEDLPVVVKINGVTQFTGFVDRPVLSVSKKRLTIKALDGFKFLNKKKCLDYVFVNTSLSDILEWLISDCGGVSSYNIENPNRTVTYIAFNSTETVKARLQEAVDSVGGSLWFDEAGTLQFKAGFASTFSSTTVGSVTVSDLKDIQDLKWLPTQANKIVVTGRSKSITTKKEPVFTWSGVVPPEGWPDLKDENGDALPNEEWKALFNTPVHPDYVDGFADVEFEADSGLSLNEAKYNSNFDTGRLKYPDHMFLQIDNSTAYDKNVSKLLIKARKVVETEYSATVQVGAGDTEKTISNEFISGENWASALANWLLEEWNDKFECTVPMSDFEKGVSWKVGDKINIIETSSGLSHRAWIRKIDIDFSKSSMTFVLRSDRASAFSYSNAPGTKTTGSNVPEETEIGDGSAPATPTWASTPLATFFIGGKTYIQVDWEANSESDLKGYEVAWSYDGSNWYNSGLTSETSLVIEVRAGVTVYAKVRAKDIEGFESSWTSSENITSAKDTTIPDNLSSISATGGFDLIYVSWVHAKPTDFSHYIVQRAADPYSSWSEVAIVQSKEFIDKSAAAGTYYKYRVKAVDIYGNEAAAWATTSTGVTCTSISSELSDLEGELSTLDGELAGLAGELSTLESELENLQFADIGGTITEVQIGDDTVSAPKLKSNSVESAKIKAGAVTAEKIAAGAVTTEKLYAAAVTAEKIAASAVTTEKLYAAAVTALKIAADAVEANHIKAGAITANKLEATLDLSVGRIIKVGDYVQIGKGVGPTGKTGDGIYITVDAYFRIGAGLFMDEGLWQGKSAGERIHPFMESNILPAGYVVSNSASSSLAWYLFRESISTYITHAADAWSQIKLPVRKTLSSYNIYSFSSLNYATAWKMQGSNDGVNWTDLDVQTEIEGWSDWYETDFEIEEPKAFLYYRLLITAIEGSGARIGSIKLFDAAGWKFSLVGAGSDPNFFAWDGQLNLKGNLILATDENVIEFEDSGIELGDGAPSSGENFIYFKRGRTGEYISWLSEYLIEAAERNSFGVLANEYVDATFSLNVMASDTVEANNKAYLKAELRNTSSANTMTALMEIIRLGSASTHGYFKFSHPINVLYPTSQDASDMPQGTILIQGNDLYFKDNSGASGAWKKVSASLASPS